MNTANLQLEGLLLAVASLNQLLVSKGVIAPEDIDRTLAMAEENALGDYRVSEDLSPANRDAVAFPIRLLRHANRMAGEGSLPSFGELARMVGASKEPYNDQR